MKLNSLHVSRGVKINLVIVLLAVIFTVIVNILPAVYAEYLPQPVNQDLQFSITSNNATGCNVTTMDYLNSTRILNIPMTKNFQTFYVLIKGNNLSQVGSYCFNIECTDGANTQTGSVCREVTGTGTNLSISQSIIYLIFLIAAISIFGLCLYYAIRIPWNHGRDEEGYVVQVNDLKYAKLFLIVMSYVALMFISGLLRGITANFIPEIGVSGFFEWIYWIMLSFMYPLIVASLIFALIIFLTNKKLTKAIENGLPSQ